MRSGDLWTVHLHHDHVRDQYSRMQRRDIDHGKARSSCTESLKKTINNTIADWYIGDSVVAKIEDYEQQKV